jgi:predicted TIM-barrel fold metal-dependent hydrolase
LPFWSDRTNSLARVAGLHRTVSEVIRSNFYLTCSGMLNPTFLRHALEVTTADRLMFSTDYPFQSPTPSDISGFLDEFGDVDERAAFAAGNATRLLRLG